MYSVPPSFSKLRLPLGDSVIYPTARPSIRTLVRQIDYQMYSVQTYLFPTITSGLFLRAIGIGRWLSVTLFGSRPSLSFDSQVHAGSVDEPLDLLK